MGAINYRTSKYITLGLVPYDAEDLAKEIIATPEDFDIDPDDLNTAADLEDDFIRNFVGEAIEDMYSDDFYNAKSILSKYDFEFFDPKFEYGYYEGAYIDLNPELISFYDEETRKDALKEVPKLEQMLKELAGCGYVACSPGWVTGYEDYNETLKAIDDAIKEIKQDIKNVPIGESVQLTEDTSVYLPKLKIFLQDVDDEVYAWVINVLNKIFTGLKKDFGGYIEGKRPTVKDYGTYKTFSMQLQTKNAVKPGEEDNGRSWNHYYPLQDYCSGMGTEFTREFEGNRFNCITNKSLDTESFRSNREEYEALSPSKLPIVGVDTIGLRGKNYKNLSKEEKGNTYQVIVSVPVESAGEYTNPFMTKSGDTYSFRNSSQESGRNFSVSYDMSDGEFEIVEYEKDSADRFTKIYRRSRNSLKAFQDLVKTFNAKTTCSQVASLIADHGVKLEHSWWFNPYID